MHEAFGNFKTIINFAMKYENTLFQMRENPYKVGVRHMNTKRCVLAYINLLLEICKF